MAVLPSLPGIEVSVCVNNVPLREYEGSEEVSSSSDGTDSVPTIVRYVESTIGQEFSIKYSIDEECKVDCPTISFNSIVDAFRERKLPYIKAKNILPWSASHEGIPIQDPQTKKLSIKPFIFCGIKTASVGDGQVDITQDEKKMEGIGQITVQVRRKAEAKRSQRRNNHLSQATENGISGDLKVHEKALKGQAKYHGASLGKARPCSMKIWVTEPLDKLPIARFVFRYRSKEALKQLLILERTPEPEEPEDTPNSPSPAAPAPSLSAFNLDNLNDNQKRELKVFMQSLLRGNNNSSGSPAPDIKRERQDNAASPSSTPRIKRERYSAEGSSSQCKRARNSSEKVTIDLTDD